MFWFLSADSWFAGIVWCFKLPCLCDACTAWVVGEHPVLGSQSLACVGEQPLWAVCANVQPPTQQGNFFASIWMEFPVFQFVPITSCPFTGHSREELQLLSLPYQVFIPFGEITLSCICSRLNSPSFLTFYFCVRYIKALIIFIGSLSLTLVQHRVQLCPTGAELRRKINSLDPPAVLAFAGFYSRFFVYHDNKYPDPSAKLPSSQSNLLCAGAWGYS